MSEASTPPVSTKKPVGSSFADLSVYKLSRTGAQIDADLALARSAVQPNDPALTRAREWTAATVDQAEAEAGIATNRRAWTAQRVRQALLAWWNSSAAKLKLDGIADNATANATNAQLRDRSTHTGTQPASTITGLATVATTGSYNDLSDVPAFDASNITGLATVAISGSYNDLTNKPTPGTTDAQLRDRATHTGTQVASTITGLATVATSGSYNDLLNKPALGTAATTNTTDYATAAQGGKADTALQPAAIGVTVQAYDPAYVKASDANTWTAEQTFKETKETVFALSGTTPAIDPTNGTIQTWTLSGASTPTLSFDAGQSVTLMIAGGGHAITWPTLSWVGGTAPALINGKQSVIVLWKVGASVFGMHLGDA